MFQEIERYKVDFNIFMGFDGFIDEILRPVKYKSRDATVMFKTMKEFSSYLKGKSGKSCSIEMELEQKKIGGNVPIVANALGNLGCNVTCVGAFGFPEINSVFEQMSDNCQMNSVAEPGHCSALEFEDGKLMLSVNEGIDTLDYKKMISIFTEDKLIKAIDKSDAIAFLNWGELYHSNNIWSNILENIIPKCELTRKKIMLVDFSDFSGKSKADVEEMLEILKRYAEYFEITVSVNKNEMDLLIDKLQKGEKNMDLNTKVMTLAKKIECKNFVVHLLEFSCYVKDNVVYTVKKDVIKNPKIITGGGDNFNAGLLLGLLMGMDIEKAIYIGSALSCLYVQEGKSIKFNELINYER